MYNNAFICYNSCPIPTPKNSSPTPHLGFDCAGAQRHQKQSHMTRYGLAARRLLANVRTVPPWQPSPTALLSTIDTNLANIREWAILDSGASSHFLQVDAPLLLKKETANPIVVTVANGEKASSTHEGVLDVPGLPDAARNAHVIPGIKHSLLSIVRLCNAGCEVSFSKWGVGVEVRYRGKVIMKGSKSTIDGLWYVPITQNSEVNLDQHCKPQQEAATYAPQAQNSFLASSVAEFSMPQPPITVEDDEITVKTSNATQNAQIAANVTTQITTFSREELAMYHHQSLGSSSRALLVPQ